MNFAEKLKFARKIVLKLSQRKLAAHTGIPVRTIEDWERGKYEPPPYRQEAILRQIAADTVFESHLSTEQSAYVRDNALDFYVPDVMYTPTSGLAMMDLFCGAGGFSVGASWAGFYPAFGIDHLEPAAATWRKNHPQAISCMGDIRRADPAEVKAMLAHKGITHISLITAGIPCQGFSVSNRKHSDNDSRNFLFLELLRHVKAFSPDYIIIENVSGLRSTAHGQFEAGIKNSVEDLGYAVTTKLLNAADYGVPQLRQRLFFIGVKRKSGLARSYAFPDGGYNSAAYRTVADAFSDLPGLGVGEHTTGYASPPLTDYQRLMRGMGGIGIPQPTQLYNHASPHHTPEVVGMIAGTKQGEPMYPNFTQRIRLNSDAPSPTVLAGGIRPQFQFGHPTQARGLSIRERARLQSFPDSYEFCGGMVQERVLTNGGK
jgi:DNA (cytosine-5)-methyltransferase 1